MKRKAFCPVCGKAFTAARRTQQYCSAYCRYYAYRHKTPPSSFPDGKGAVLRTFQCLRCGTVVHVTRPSDKRMKFCSSRCERLYWKHSKKQNVRSEAVARTFSCRNCGQLVRVTAADDRRTAFCSAQCRAKWYSRHRKENPM